MKRACIFVFYDNDGVVDDYNIYNLKQLRTVCDYIVAVVNGKITPEGRGRLIDVCDDMFVRRNEGYDTWAWKDGISFIGWDELYKSYDELILTNDSMFGPFRPLTQVFEEMDSVDCDFWGNNRVYEDKNVTSFLGKPIPMPYKPEFISSNFRVIRKKLLNSYEFRRFWDELPPIMNYWDASVLGEWSFQYDMVNAGYTFATVCRGDQRGLSPSPTTMEALDQISRLGVPYMRKKALMGGLNELTNFKKSTEPANIIRYIKDHTDYDIDMIYQCIIRKMNLYNMHHRLSLTSVLPKRMSAASESGSKTGVVFHAYYTDIFPQYVEYLKNFPDDTDIYFTVSEAIKDDIKAMAQPLLEKHRVEFIPIQNRGRDVSAMLIGGREAVLSDKYDLICFMHDKKGLGAGDKKYSCIGAACSETCFENVCASKDYVKNVIALFDANPRLGIAFPPPPTHAGYFVNVDGDWGHPQNFIKLQKLFSDFGISVPLDRSLPPVAPFGSIFWFRPQALRKLFEHEWKYDDFPEEPMKSDGEISHAIERGHAYFAQAEGFFPMMIMNDEYAASEIIYYGANLKRAYDVSVSAFGKKANAAEQMLALNVVSASGRSKRDMFKAVRSGSPRTASRNAPHSIWDRLSRSKFKKIAKCILPHSIWEELRKKKCEETGEVYIEI